MRNKGNTQSLWTDGGPMLSFPSLEGNVEADVAVIGAGITGLTTALSLQLEGKKVVLLEAFRIGAGTTGGTSAHITQMLDERYHSIIQNFGEGRAKVIADSIKSSIERIRYWTEKYSIECDLTEVDGYLYTEVEDHVKLLIEECEAANRLGIPLEFLPEAPMPFTNYGAVRFPNQFYFHPMRYCEELARQFSEAGGFLFEMSHVVDVKDGSPCTVKTERGAVTAQNVVMATHTPIGLSLLHTELEPSRSYVLTAEIGEPIPDGIFWDTYDPYFYTRPFSSTNRNHIIVGGNDHHTGDEEDSHRCFEELENYVRRRYNVTRIIHRWSAQFYYSCDGLPLIGRSPLSHNVYVATGYAAEGLTFGTLAGMMLCDELMGRKHPAHDIYSPTRLAALKSPGDFFSENLHNAKHFFVDRLKGAEADAIAEVGVGEGKLVSVNGKKLAIYRESEEKFHALLPTCQHMGCIVHWNSAEKTWDCPCHGGRYSAEGEVIEGPPLKSLSPVQLPEPVNPGKQKIRTPERVPDMSAASLQTLFQN